MTRFSTVCQEAGRPPSYGNSATHAPTGPDVPIMPRKGLHLREQIPFEKWLAIGQQLSRIHSSSAWCLGDWLVYGEAAYAGRYRDAIEQTSLDYQTLRNYAWVTRRFPFPRRRDTLSFGHHAEVAALPEPEQEFWLRKAEEFSWSVKQLRREVRASLKERSDSPEKCADAATDEGYESACRVRVEIGLSPYQLKRCRAAADSAGLSIDAWMSLALEHAAREAC
jgi:hypothetical protein